MVITHRPPPRPQYGDPAMQWWKGRTGDLVGLYHVAWFLPVSFIFCTAFRSLQWQRQLQLSARCPAALSKLLDCQSDSTQTWLTSSRCKLSTLFPLFVFFALLKSLLDGLQCWQLELISSLSLVAQLKLQNLNDFGGKIWFQCKLKPAQCTIRPTNLKSVPILKLK